MKLQILRERIDKITFIFLSIAALVSAAWLVQKPDFEPLASYLVLLATIIGLVMDKLKTELSRRREILVSVIYELHMNKDFIQIMEESARLNASSKEKTVHATRLYVFATDYALASGVFNLKKDKKLFKLLASWKYSAGEINQRIEMASTFDMVSICVTFNRDTIQERIPQMDVFQTMKNVRSNLVNHLFENYEDETWNQ